MTDFMVVHAEAIVFDSTCPLIELHECIDWYKEGGATVIAPTVGHVYGTRTTLDEIAKWSRLFESRDDVVLVRQVADIRRAKSSGRIGIYLHFQGTGPIEDNLNLVDAYKALGVGVIQLTYNLRNRVGDGCEERTDAGLSKFGIALIRKMNEARVIVDCSHTGLRTSLDAIEVSSAPVILSHANPRQVYDCARNVEDELLKAIAASGGAIGVTAFPGFVCASNRPTVDDLLAHIDYIAELVGIDHVALGLDYYPLQAGVASEEEQQKFYAEAVKLGVWGDSYPPPPHFYPQGIETPRTLYNLTDSLLRRGYGADDVKKILGGNWMRVMKSVWG